MLSDAYCRYCSNQAHLLLQAADSIAKNDLVTNGKFGSYPNIFVLQERPEVTARMEAATAASEAVVGMHFASLR